MADFERKYSPRTFGDVIGQERAAEWCRGQIQREEFRSVLFAGPTGIGKSSLTRLYGQTIFCEHRFQDHSPCGACESCRAIARESVSFPDHEVIDCCEKGRVDDIAWLQGVARIRPMTSEQRVIVLDEVHDLSARAQDSLLKVLTVKERWGPTFILATTRPDKVLPTVKSRVQQLDLNLLTDDQSVGFLNAICLKEGLSVEPGALELLVAARKGYPRFLLRDLEQVASFGPVTLAAVRQVRGFDFADELAAFVAALSEHNLKKLLEIISRWPLEPSAKLDSLQRLFAHVYFNDRLHLDRPDLLIDVLAPDTRIELAQLMAHGAEQIGVDLNKYWEDALELLSASIAVSETDLNLRILKFYHLVVFERSGGATKPIAAKPLAQRSPKPTRIKVAATGRKSPSYMPREKANLFYETASFMTQHYGVFYNAQVQLMQNDLSTDDQCQAEKLASRLAHEIRIKLSYRLQQKTSFHFIYTHEVANRGLATLLLMHIPNDYLDETSVWIQNRFCQKYNLSDAEIFTSLCRSDSRQERVKFHWECVRAQLINLDPRILARSSEGTLKPLVELLGIKPSSRQPPTQALFGQSFGRSESLSKAAKDAAATNEFGFLSALHDCAWPFLYSGWEFDEFKDRQRELRRRASEEANLLSRFEGFTKLAIRRRDEARRELCATYPEDPRQRPRSWPAWWLTKETQAFARRRDLCRK